LLLLWHPHQNFALFPTQKMKGQLALNRAKVFVIGPDHPGAYTPCRQGDQHIKGQVAQLGGLIVLLSSEPMEDLGGLQPLLFRWRQHLAPLAQFQNKLPFSGCSSPVEQFVEHDRRTTDNIRRLQQAKREASGSEFSM